MNRRLWLGPAAGITLRLCLGLLLTGGCRGLEHAGDRLAATPYPSLPESPLDDDDDYDDLDDEVAPQLDPAVQQRLRQAYRRLQQTGRLKEPCWHFREPLPPLPQVARLHIDADSDAGITDGYVRTLLVPVDQKQAPCGIFYVTREGGFAGWLQWLGPHRISASAL